jgi:hypothetical protein
MAKKSEPPQADWGSFVCPRKACGKTAPVPVEPVADRQGIKGYAPCPACGGMLHFSRDKDDTIYTCEAWVLNWDKPTDRK